MSDHLITIEATPISRINRIMQLTDDILNADDWGDVLYGKTLANLFLEPSTRSRVASELAMKHLGGTVVNLIGKESTSMEKDEELRETLGTLSQYVDVIAVRADSRISSTDLELCEVPVINMGDADGTHPTQALADLYTIRSNFPKLETLNVLVMGDCKSSRAAHSFVAICLKFGMRVACYSPKDIELPYFNRTVKEGDVILDNKATAVVDGELEAAVEAADVIYCLRFQKERNASGRIYDKSATTGTNYASRCGFKEEWLGKISRTTLIMHPSPRGDEMPKKVDKDRRAAYFQQMRNGLYVKMAILEDALLPSNVEEE